MAVGRGLMRSCGQRVAVEVRVGVLGRIPIVADSRPERIFEEVAASLAATKVRRRIKVL